MKRLTIYTVAMLVLLALVAVPAWAQDTDGDGVDDAVDNCPGTMSTDLRDSDADGLGNPCDPTPFVTNPPCGEINATDDKGPLACNIFTLRIPLPTGDTLPPGSGISYVFSVFDTGSTAVLINPNTVAFLNVNDQSVPGALDHRIWGAQSLGPLSLGAPLDFPEAQADAKVPSQGTNVAFPNLLGGPVTNEVLAYIDYTINVSRGPYNFSEPLLTPTGMFECPAITFFEPGDSPMPMPLFWVDLEPFGGTAPGMDGGSRGQRYFMRGMRFSNGANTVQSPASPTPIATGNRFLYDTGNTTTQISVPMATALGIDLSPATNPPDDTITIGGELLNCYQIDKVEIDADDGSNQYVINDALVCVKTAPAFGGAADANIGANFFETTQVLFDGPQSRLGLFLGRCQNGATTINDLLDLSSANTAFDPTPAPNAPAGVFTITATFTNISASDITDLSFEVDAITGGNLVLNADGGPGGVGAIASVPPGDLGNGILEQGESFSFDFEIGLATAQPFSFFVDAHGTTAP